MAEPKRIVIIASKGADGSILATTYHFPLMKGRAIPDRNANSAK